MHREKALNWDIRHERFCNVPMYHVIAMRTYPSNQTIWSLSMLFGSEWRQNIPFSCVHLLDIILSFLLLPYLDQTYAGCCRPLSAGTILHPVPLSVWNRRLKHSKKHQWLLLDWSELKLPWRNASYIFRHCSCDKAISKVWRIEIKETWQSNKTKLTQELEKQQEK